MKRFARGIVVVALFGAVLGIQPARADRSVNCSHPSSIWIGPTIFPPIACQAQLDAGTYHFVFSWTKITSGFVVVGAGDDSTTAMYFNMRVDLGFVTHYETERGEAYPPAKPPLRGPVSGTFVLPRGGLILFSVFPEQVSAPTQAIVIPAGSFHLTARHA